METSQQEQTEIALEMVPPNPIISNLGLIVATIAILSFLWKIASFLQGISHRIVDIHKDLCKLSKEQLKLQNKYEDIYFFLIRQHGIETVQKQMRQHREEETENE